MRVSPASVGSSGAGLPRRSSDGLIAQEDLLVEPAASSTDTPAPPRSRPGRAQEQASEAKDRPWLHVLLFALSLVSTIWVGITWAGRMPLYTEVGEWVLFAQTHESMGEWVWLFNSAAFWDGMRYAVPLLAFLTVHEFGHYIAARRHRINTSLPYYIPFPFNGIGNFGAVISIREAIPSTRKLFDVGVSGPLAGFVVALGVLLYGFATLPPPEYLLDLPGHEALKAHIQQHGTFPSSPPDPGGGAMVIVVGQTPLFWLLSQFFANVPPMYEMYHYPVLFAGWLGLFFTALNLLPVGQLDGGHVLYALLGRRWHRLLARGFVLLLLLSGGIGFVEAVGPVILDGTIAMEALLWASLAGIYYGYLRTVFKEDRRLILPALAGLLLGVFGAEVAGPVLTQYGYTGWLLFALLIIFFIRVEHPPVVRNEKLTPRRRLLGYGAIAIFLLCFSLRPLSVL